MVPRTSVRKPELKFLRCVKLFELVGLSGLEPPTSRLSGVRSNLLSYRPAWVSSSGPSSLLVLFFVLFFFQCSVYLFCTLENEQRAFLVSTFSLSDLRLLYHYIGYSAYGALRISLRENTFSTLASQAPRKCFLHAPCTSKLRFEYSLERR